MKPYFCATFFCLFATLAASANDSAHVKFTFASPLAAEKFSIVVHDGIHDFNIDPRSKPRQNGRL